MIGVAGVNHYAETAGQLFNTQDRDLFLPKDPRNAIRAWRACESCGFKLWSGEEPLGRPLDLFLAKAIVEREALVRAVSPRLSVDLTLVMAGYSFPRVWPSRRVFVVQGVRVPVARLSHIVASKAAAGRPKDRLFLATHEEALRQLLERRRRSR